MIDRLDADDAREGEAPARCGGGGERSVGGERAAAAAPICRACTANCLLKPTFRNSTPRAAEALGLPPMAALNVSIDAGDAVTEAGLIASLVEDMIVVQVSPSSGAACMCGVQRACGARWGEARGVAGQGRD